MHEQNQTIFPARRQGKFGDLVRSTIWNLASHDNAPANLPLDLNRLAAAPIWRLDHDRATPALRGRSVAARSQTDRPASGGHRSAERVDSRGRKDHAVAIERPYSKAAALIAEVDVSALHPSRDCGVQVLDGRLLLELV